MSEQYSAAPIWEDPKATGEPIDLLTLVATVVCRWPLIALMGMGGGVLGLLTALSLHPTFTSKALFLPPPQRFSATDNPVAALLKPPSSSIYSSMLLSDSVLGDVVTHSNLQAMFQSRDPQDARAALQRLVRVSTDSSGFVTLQVTYKDPRMAQQIASNFLAALSRLNDRLAVSDASQQRMFYKSELEREKNELESAEIALEQKQEKSGVVAPLSQTEAGLTAIDATRVEIRQQEVRLAALEKSETNQAPEVVVAKSQLQALQGQLRALSSGSGPAGGGLSAAAAPKANLEFITLEREVKYHQALFDAISKQYENARMEETSAAPGVQVVDFPEVPLRKSWPSRSMFTAVGGLLGLVLALAAIVIRNQATALLDNPDRVASLNSLRAAFRHPRMSL